ncbi:FAD-dependent oxidoreductase [Timonella sp. A28]|uniref:FAD-dependent oxidoreductase n=1 Tax=Timonella sp. A28 TaxID=3442640 RepID=UPI003EBC3548
MKIVVIGGVAAGASVAARARRLDEHAEIVVLERGHHISFANCGLPYHIGEVITERERLLVQTPQSLRESLNIDARIGQEVIAIDKSAQKITVRNVDDGTEYEETYDALALCPGSEPVRPPLPGINLPQVMVLRRIGDMDAIKRQLDDQLKEKEQGARSNVRAVVIGAGYIGIEMAENLRHRDVDVDVVETADQILPPVDREIAVPVENHLRLRGVNLHLKTAAAAFVELPDGKIRVELNNNSALDADLVILSVGVKPAHALAQQAGLAVGKRGGVIVDTHMQTSDPHIWAAGDVVETEHTVLNESQLFPLAGPANRQGRVAAENMCGRNTTYTTTQGTSIVKVFDMTAGGTGATEAQLQERNLPYRAVHVHPSGHAGYYPGTAMMHLKVLFNPETGKLLGAQASGFDGVDKRLDVLATALRLGATVYDLEELELAYAPPFGSAKDPVNMAGFVAANTIRGDLNLWYAQDFPAALDGARTIDVRSADEFDLWHIPGAENVPLGQLRESSEAWDRNTPIRLYCAVGFRSYLAYRALVQRGFTDVRTLSGGSVTFRAWHEVEGEGAQPQYAEISHASANTQTAAEFFNQVPTAPHQNLQLDCTGLACPGPIMKLKKTVTDLAPGDEVTVTVSDPGFAHDGPAWAAANGHDVLELTPSGPGYVMKLRVGNPQENHPHTGSSLAPAGALETREGMSFVVFSGELDKLLAAFIIANGALAMGKPVRMFFTFWGLNALRRENPPARDRSALDKMFAAMMPSGPDALKLSNMNMGGAGTAMIKKVMKDHSVSTLPELMESAIEGGAEIIACTMTMDLLGIAESDLIDGLELGGVATFIAAAEKSGSTLFI